MNARTSILSITAALAACLPGNSFADPPPSLIPQIQRTAKEIYLMADIDGSNKTNEFILIEKASGSAYAYSAPSVKTSYTNLSLSNPFNCGTAPITDAAVLDDAANGPQIATVTSDQNSLTLTSELDQAASNLTESITYSSYYPLPSDLAAIAPPDGGFLSSRDDLLVLSSSLQNTIGYLNRRNEPPTSTFLKPAFATNELDQLQSIQIDSAQSFLLGIASPDSGKEIYLMAAASANENSNFNRISAVATSADTTDFTFYPVQLPDKIFLLFSYSKGNNKIAIYTVTGESLDLIDQYSARQALAFVQTLESPDGYRLFLAYTDGNASVMEFDGTTWNELHALEVLSDSQWLGVLGAKDGSFYALHGTEGIATHYEQIAYPGSNNYAKQSSGTLNRSSLSAAARDSIQAVSYSEAPFLGSPVPIKTYKYGDWSTNANADIELTSRQFKDAADGLYYQASKNVGTLPAGTSLALNQYQSDISFWFGSGTVGTVGPVVSITPASATRLKKAIQPEIESASGGSIFYRIGTSGTFTPANSGIPVISTDSTIEAYAEKAGIKGPIARASYTFKQSPTKRDSDGDGLPDALELELGSDPLLSDTDGDASSDLADLLAGGASAVTDADSSASTDFKELAAGGYGALELSAYGQAAYPKRETVIRTAADPASGYESVVDAFNAEDHSGNRTDAPLGAVSGLATVTSATGDLLGSGRFTAAGAVLSDIAITEPKHFLVSEIQTFSTAPENRSWQADFELNSGGWQIVSANTKSSVPRFFRPDEATAVAARVLKSQTDSRLLIYDKSQSAAQWLGNYTQYTTDPNLSTDAQKAGRLRGILCEAYSLDTDNDGYLHLILSTETAKFVSKGQFLPNLDLTKIDAASADALWTSYLFKLDTSTFSRVYSNNPDATLEDSLGEIIELAFAISETGHPESLLSGNIYKSSTTHNGFAIDKIRAVGMPSGGYPMVAISAVPDQSERMPSYSRDAETSLNTAVNQWINEFKTAAVGSQMQSELTVESTLAAILLEQALNQALYAQEPANHTSNKQLAVFHAATGKSTAVEQITANDLDFIRYPSRTIAFPTVTIAWEPKTLLEKIELKLQKNESDGGQLHAVAHALYRIAGTFSGIAPETYDQPLQALYDLLQQNELSTAWMQALLSLDINPDTLAVAISEAQTIVTQSLTDATRDMESALQLTLGDNLGSFVDAFSNSWEILDRDGDPFLFPEQFAFPDGSVVQFAGYKLPDGPQNKRLEVTGITLVSLPKTTPQDTDGNLLDDRWEIVFFGATGADPFEDPDLDNYNNLSEFINGTDPVVAMSVDKGDDPSDLPPELEWPASIRIERLNNGNLRVILPMSKSQADQFGWTVEASNNLQSYNKENKVTEFRGNAEQVFVVEPDAFDSVFFRLKAILK